MNETVMNNTTALNETNSTIWQVNDISGIQKLFAEGEMVVSDLLISWDMNPSSVYFRLLVIVLSVLVLYQLFITGTSRTGGLFRYVLMLVLVIAILIALKII